MSERRRLSPEEVDTIAMLREKGWTIGQIARRVGCSAGTVSWHCLRLGADPPGAKVPTLRRGPMAVMRGGHEVRRFSEADDDSLLALEREGLTHTEIGRRLGRRPNSIRGRLLTLARRDARAEAAEHRT